MAPSPLHRLAASLAAALVAASCSTPPEVATGDANESVAAPAQPEPSQPEPSQPEPSQPAPTPSTEPQPQSEQSQPNKPLTIAEQRAAALAEHWLQSARKLRADGDLARAYAELLQAERAAPGNQAVATEIVELLKVYTPDQPAVRKPSPQMSRIAQQRAVAMVEYQLRTALQLTAQKDFDGALEQLREAEQGIARHKAIDWGDLEAKVRAARTDAERKKGGNE